MRLRLSSVMAAFQKAYLTALRHRSRAFKCPRCDKPFDSEDSLAKHLSGVHVDENLDPAQKSAETSRLLELAGIPKGPEPSGQPLAVKRPADTDRGGGDGDSSIYDADGGGSPRNPADSHAPSSKRLKSPSSVQVQQDDQDVASSAAARSSGYQDRPEVAPDTVPRINHGRRLWTDGDAPLSRNPGDRRTPAAGGNSGLSPKQRSWRTSQSRMSTASHESVAEDPQVNILISQPETRPISLEQLIAEVKGIYSGLVMVESKCIEVDTAQSQSETPLNNEQWQALIALHRTLLQEHHDFFLASQHPSASPALRRLAAKYAMPARMWRHGIHSFLELLRHRLPDALDHMLSFLYMAYSMMGLLYETVPDFQDTWIECLGDLSRYRMAIEDEDIKDREIWTGVSRYWYSLASDRNPTIGRLYHHQAILARPNAVQQLFFYVKSLCVAIPFPSARESILTLFEPILNGSQTRLSPVDTALVRANGILYTGSHEEELQDTQSEFHKLLDNQIARTTKRWMVVGRYTAVVHCGALMGYGDDNNLLMKLFKKATANSEDVSMDGVPSTAPATSRLRVIQAMVYNTDEIVLHRYGDPNVLSYIHIRLAYMLGMAAYSGTMVHLQQGFHWKLLAQHLNSLITPGIDFSIIESTDFPRPVKGNVIPLPEDWSQRGLLWTEQYFPDDWFSHNQDEEEKMLEMASTTPIRKERVLWLGCQLALREESLLYDPDTHKFTTTPEYDVEIRPEPSVGPWKLLSKKEMAELPWRLDEKAGGLDLQDDRERDEKSSAMKID